MFDFEKSIEIQLRSTVGIIYDTIHSYARSYKKVGEGIKFVITKDIYSMQ